MALTIFLASTILTTANALPIASAPEIGANAWTNGRSSWEAARTASGDNKTWDEPNSCDPAVLHSSAPLTVLYALSSISEKVQQQREADGRVEKPLEVHVLGAAYPFEGRSDWSLLANYRPPEIPKVRVTLVLGTPFQSDNVPPLSGQPNSLIEEQENPAGGRWSNRESEIICTGEGRYGTKEMDDQWSKEDLCRDHGNGVEVICLEKYYQDVRDQLPKPDMAVMFSPGFPQLSRRSWDTVLIGLLNTKVPIMVSDVSNAGVKNWGHAVTPGFDGAKPVTPGGRWYPSKSEEFGEDWQTWLTLTKYRAQLIKARRGPFPISHVEGGRVLAKNAVVQIYQGYKPGASPTQQVSKAETDKYNQMFDRIKWTSKRGRCKAIKHQQRGFEHPTTRAFDSAMRRMYKDNFDEVTPTLLKTFTERQKMGLQKYGLLKRQDGTYKTRRWDLKAWIFIQRTLGCLDY